ncbi:hypothetical protein JG687_00007818 [Phytophthora cactorum]|uniref:Uncharacterized protein n=1 Tax=Phytophthora cactorum TaxID=29920 RepID=A0A8T1UE56_9STRA|nr:hypothetical protein JG687_00007818 [Phytophthora cactorum]
MLADRTAMAGLLSSSLNLFQLARVGPEEQSTAVALREQRKLTLTPKRKGWISWHSNLQSKPSLDEESVLLNQNQTY